MYVGKRVAKKKKGYIRVFFVWSLALMLLFSAAALMYAKFLEGIMTNSVHASDEDNTPMPLAEKGEPTTFLLLGSDTRGGSDRGRADTIMILRVNSDKKIAYLLSIPRDTRVKIPGYGRNKVNAAYQLGGPRLMVKTLEEFLGLQINHYAVVDFQGFKKIVDELGGVDIDVEKRLIDRRHQIDIHPGYQHMDGEEALKYVRIRKVDDDFHRAERQQKFLKAVVRKVMSVRGLVRIPQLAGIAARHITADSGLTITRMIIYGQMFRSIGSENLHTLTLPGNSEMVGGVSYVITDEHKMAWLVDRINNDLPLKLTDEEKQNENIKLKVQNGSGKAGLAKKLAEKLEGLNFKVTSVGNARSFTYYETRIIASEEKAELAGRIKSLLGFGRIIIENDAITDNSADVLVIAGRDYGRMVEGSEP